MLVVSQESPAPTSEPFPIVEDVQNTSVLYMQTDPRWSGLPYAESDVGEAGCGLVCAAMAATTLTGDSWDPPRLLNAVGNDYVVGGVNDVQGLADWVCGLDPTVSRSVTYDDQDRAVADLEAGNLVFGSMTGQLHEGGRSYGGHVVLLVSERDGYVAVNDPCEAQPVTLSPDEFHAVAWDYFITIGRNNVS